MTLERVLSNTAEARSELLTIRFAPSTRDKLAELARKSNKPLSALVSAIVVTAISDMQ